MLILIKYLDNFFCSFRWNSKNKFLFSVVGHQPIDGGLIRYSVPCHGLSTILINNGLFLSYEGFFSDGQPIIRIAWRIIAKHNEIRVTKNRSTQTHVNAKR